MNKSVASVFAEILSTMAEVFIHALRMAVSVALDVDLSDLAKVFEKTITKKSESDQLTDAFDEVTAKLQESKAVIEDAMRQVDEQRKVVEQLKEEAEISRQVSNMNEDQLKALSKVMEKTLTKNDKQSMPRNILINLFFCVLGAVLGIIFTRLFT